MTPHIDNAFAGARQSLAAFVPNASPLHARPLEGPRAALLLPGEDATEFERQRLAMFRTYLPQTEDEAELVESLAEFRWLRRRYRPWQVRFDGQTIASGADAAGRVSEPIAHQRLHSSIDVTKHRARVERLWNGARAKLLDMQRQRRQGLVEGAVALPPVCYMTAEGEVVGPVGQEAPQGGAPIGFDARLPPRKKTEAAARGREKTEPVGFDGPLAREFGFDPQRTVPPEWLTARAAGSGIAASGNSRPPPTLMGSGSGWVGYAVVGSA